MLLRKMCENCSECHLVSLHIAFNESYLYKEASSLGVQCTPGSTPSQLRFVLQASSSTLVTFHCLGCSIQLVFLIWGWQHYEIQTLIPVAASNKRCPPPHPMLTHLGISEWTIASCLSPFFLFCPPWFPVHSNCSEIWGLSAPNTIEQWDASGLFCYTDQTRWLSSVPFWCCHSTL